MGNLYPPNPALVQWALKKIRAYSVHFMFIMPANSVVSFQFAPPPGVVYTITTFIVGTPRDMAQNPLNTTLTYLQSTHEQYKETVLPALETVYKDTWPCWIELHATQPLNLRIVNGLAQTITWPLGLALGEQGSAAFEDMLILWKGQENWMRYWGNLSLKQIEAMATKEGESK